MQTGQNPSSHYGEPRIWALQYPMNVKPHIILAILALLFAPHAFAAAPTYLALASQLPNPKSESIAEREESRVELVAKKEDPEIKIHNEEDWQSSPEGLPEYFGALPGGIVSFSAVVALSSNMMAFYQLAGLFLALGITIGFLCSYTTYVRKKSDLMHSCFKRL